MSKIAKVVKRPLSVNSLTHDLRQSNAMISNLVSQTSNTLSAFGVHNWKAVAAHTEDAVEELASLSFYRSVVYQASVTFIVYGIRELDTALTATLKSALDAGSFQKSEFNLWTAAARQISRRDALSGFDEAIRSASLAAMALMLTAKNMGYVSQRVLGFDVKAVAEAFALDECDLPVMLIVVDFPASSYVNHQLDKPIKTDRVLRFA